MTHWQILVVDDEPLNLEIIQEYLDGGPYALETAEDGAQAMARLEQRATAYDLVILDRMMPVMDGMTLLRNLKQDPRYAHIPVIMQTAAAAPDQVREGLNAGCYYYLTKPYKSAALLSIVHAALADLRQERLLADALATTPPVPATPNADYAFSTLEEARRLAALLAAQCPQPAAAALGLSELLINAVEHGNLGISYAEKTRLKREDRWEDEVATRLNLPEYRSRKATASFTRDEQQISFTITDQGAGFDWQKYLDFDPQRAFDPNGRGIAMASKLTFASLEYQGCGNRVVATVKFS